MAGNHPLSRDLPPFSALHIPRDWFSLHPPQDSTFTFFDNPPRYRPPHERPSYDPTRTPANTPLPPSPPPPPPPHPLNHLVSYVMIFPQAHPNWDSERELWSHSNAEKLIHDWDGSRKNFGRPLPVFRSSRKSIRDRESFAFDGWWIIDSLALVEPQSEALKEMLDVKEQARSELRRPCSGLMQLIVTGYRREGRTRAAWEASLSQTWVKLRLTKATPMANVRPLRDPMSLRGGPGGEVGRYLLEAGELKDELKVLNEDNEELERPGAEIRPS